MPRISLLGENGRFYKANLHCHTTRSDGALTPEQVRALYKRNGYSIVAFTDHWHFVDSSPLSQEDFLALSGYELNYDQRDSATGGLITTCHINAIARDPDRVTPIPGEGIYDLDAINRAILALNRGGFIVNLNHTAWSAMPTEDILAVEGVCGMELFNSTCQSEFLSYGELNNYQLAIARGKRFLPVAADDNHLGRVVDGEVIAGDDCCRAFTMIEAERLDAESVLNAYLSGRYYCSTGPLIERMEIDGDRLTIECSPVARAYMKTRYITLIGRARAKNGGMTRVEFDLAPYRGKTPYIMVQLVDEAGRFAATVPRII